MMTPLEYYNYKVEKLRIEIEKSRKRLTLVAFFRLLCAIVFITCCVYLFQISSLYLWMGVSFSIILFLGLLTYTNKLRKSKNYNDELLKINQNEIKALSSDYTAFNPGNEFINPSHSFSFDLDIFGPSSIFQMINRTSTRSGKQTLAQELINPGIDKKEIINRQHSIVELCDKIEWRQGFQATGQLTEEAVSDQQQIIDWLNYPSRFAGKKVYATILKALPGITIISWLLLVFGVIDVIIPAFFSFVQLLITLLNISYINNRQRTINRQIKILKKYNRLIKLIENEAFQSENLLSLKERTFQNQAKPSESFSRLIRLVGALDNRSNVILAFILNALYLSDMNCIYRIEKWSSEFRSMFPIWIQVISHFDALSSFSCFMYNNPSYAIPELSGSVEFFLDMEGGGHPLITNEDRVTNDFLQDGQSSSLYLITGANMAGKSTFLRTIGLNLILGMTGTCVCAKKFTFTPAKLYTSMRTNDSIQKQTSFFFAELKRLKFIVEELKKSEKTYILLDEILKGTNSKDQHLGSARLIQNIIKLNGVGLIATHDIELTKLKNFHPERIKNIAFEIEMEKGKMMFDYKYKDGVCQNMNATILMEQMEIF